MVVCKASLAHKGAHVMEECAYTWIVMPIKDYYVNVEDLNVEEATQFLAALDSCTSF